MLEHLRKEAKRWLKRLRAGDAVERQPPRDADHARRVEWFFENACPDHHVRGALSHARARHTAARLLQRHPEIAADSFCTAVVCGDLKEVERVLASRPAAASARCATPDPDRDQAAGDDWLKDLGPKGWEPLQFLCATRLDLPAAEDNAVAIARLLLEHGADPNVYFMAGGSRYTPLVGAIGEGEEARPPHPRRDELVKLLLERGAEPYDRQVIYNLNSHGNVLWFLELIYQRSIALGRQTDWDDPEWKMLDMGGYGTGARWFFDLARRDDNAALRAWCVAHGARDSSSGREPAVPDERWPLHTAAYRGSLTIVKALVEAGADVDAVEDKWGSTPLGAAVYSQQLPVIEFLAPRSNAIEYLVFLGHVDRVREMLAADPSRARALYDGSSLLMWLPRDDEARAIELAKLLLDNGAEPSLKGQDGRTAAGRAERLAMFDLARLLGS